MPVALVTSGPTQEPLDPVRYISNHSSGKQGFAIASALRDTGFDVLLVSGPVYMPPPSGVRCIDVHSADSMLKACMDALPVDVAICAAAVCDWRPKTVQSHKMKKDKDQEELVVEFVKNPDILKSISLSTKRPPLVVGFAAETENLDENSRKKLLSKQCDWVVGNKVGGESDVFGGDSNQICLYKKTGEKVSLPVLTKEEVADYLVSEIIQELKIKGNVSC